tara:strand:+ start:19 stop:2571 length:2553 start_codon:yes stop_codon:yes gene_type:complete
MSDFHNKWRDFLAEEEPFQKQMRSNLPDELDFLLNRGSNDKREGPGVKGATFPSGKSAPPLEEDMRLLREITEYEVEHIQQAIDEMGPDELAFNKLFGGKTRLVIDFPTLDPGSELGEFLLTFDNMDYQVDWEKGILFAEREVQDNSVDTLARRLMGQHVEPPRKKKIQMKVGKFLAKLYELASKKKELAQKVFDHLEKIGYKGQPRIQYSGQFTGKMVDAALDEQEQKRYQQLSDQIDTYVGIQGAYGQTLVHDPEIAKKMAQYWQQNADYIKKNLKDAETSQYSIILTRDPLDILRMSDFNKITSCHSPPSRGGGGSYYRCAIAEAHGHGAIAYVVETGELLESTGSETIEDAEKYIEEYDGEIFPDDIRGSHIGLSMELLPVARTRLRQFRYDNPDPEGGYDIGVQLAVPEQRIYGKKIPGFGNRVLQWAQTNQEEQIALAPQTPEGKLDLSKFIKLGGSHEDTGRGELVASLFGIDRGDAVGHLRQDTETEDELDVDTTSSVEAEYQQAVDGIEEEWNSRYQACEVNGEAEADDEMVVISLSAGMSITWSLDEWSSLPSSTSARYAISELNDIGWGWASESGATLHREGDKILLSFSIDPSKLGAHPQTGEVLWPNKEPWAADPPDFEDFCVAINAIDDMYDAAKIWVERFYKREGNLVGAKFYKMAMEISNGDIDPYEWDMELDDRHDPDEATEITATVKLDFSPEKFGVSPVILTKVLDSREFHIAIKKELLREAMSDVGTEMYLDFEASAGPSGSDVELRLSFIVRDHHPDILVDLLETAVWQPGTVDDEDKLRSISEWTLQQMLKSRLPSSMQEPDTPQELTEHKHRQAKHMYNKWRKFLCN